MSADPMDDLMLSPDAADPQQLLETLLSISSAPQAAKTGATASTFPQRRGALTPAPMPRPMPMAPPNGDPSTTGDGTDWRALIRLIAPAIGGLVAGGGHAMPHFWAGYLGQQGELDQQRQRQQQQADNRRKAAADFLMEIEHGAEQRDDPAQLAQYVDAADQAGSMAGFFKPGEIKAKGYRVPDSKIAAKKLEELDGILTGFDKAGYNVDDLATSGAVITTKDGSHIPVATAIDLTRKRPLDANNKPIAKPLKAASTEEERYLQQYAVENGYKSFTEMSTDEQDAGRQKYIASKRAETKLGDEAGPAAQLRDIVALYKTKHNGQDPPPDVMMQLRAQANRVNDKPTEVVAPTDLSGAVDAVMAHRMAPSQAVAMIGGYGKEGAAAKRALTRAILLKDPNFDFEDAEANYQFGKSNGTQTTVRYLDNIKTSIDILRKASADFKRTDVNVVNKAIAAGSGQFGSTDVAVYNMARNVVADEIAKVLQGGGTGNSTSDAKLKQAQALLDSGYSDQQLNSVLDAAQTMLDVRRKTLTKNTFLDKSGATKPKVITYDVNGNPVK